jgi:hypothetical protein
MKRLLEMSLKLAMTRGCLAAIMTMTLGLLYSVERAPAHMPFVIAAMLALSGLFFIVGRRPYLALYGAMALTLLIAAASVVKYQLKGFDLHVYDIVFTGSDPAAFAFLLGSYGQVILPILTAAVLAAILLAALARTEAASGIALKRRSTLSAAPFLVLPFVYPLNPEQPRYFHYLGGFNASSFFISVLDLNALAGGQGVSGRVAGMQPERPFKAPAACDRETARPDIFFVLSESQTDLSNFDALQPPARFARPFLSQDGQGRALNVETFGGGTWMTNLSLMTGISSADFEWQGPYLTTMLEGRVHDSLPINLQRCGYRTAVLTPMKHGFVNEGPFLESIGFETVLDYDAIGASEYVHRDRFYFDAAERFVAEHRKTDGRPLFLEIQTMFAHSPYVDRLAPEVTLAGEAMTNDPQIDEYLRRVLIAKTDFRRFLRRRNAEKEDHASIVLEFGDHQSFATKPLVDATPGDGGLADLGSLAYRTHYSIHGFNHAIDMRAFDDHDRLDVAYLGARFIKAAGLPLSPMFEALMDLSEHCRGALHLCEDRDAVDRHIRRQVDSGLLDLP